MAYDNYDEDDDYEDDDYEQMDEQQQKNANLKKMFEFEEKILKNKLKLILAKISKGSLYLNIDEKKTVKKSKDHPNLKKQINIINAILLINRAKAAAKAMSTSPSWYYIGIGALILLLIICVISILSYIIPNLFPDQSNNLESMFGVSGEDFYGIRTVYKDDEKAGYTIIEDCVELVENGIAEAKTITSISGTGGSANGTLEITISMPDEEYDYSTFDENSFSSQYGVLYSTIFDIAKEVYKVDNSTSFAGSNIVECVNGILYFGFDQTIMESVDDIISTAISNNSNFVVDGEGSVSKTDVDNQISSKLTALYSQDKYNIRTEKLFVKDYIFEDDESKMKGAEKQNFVAFIFMPKNNVTFKKLSFTASATSLEGLEIKVTNNGEEIKLNKDNQNLADAETSQAYIYQTGLFFSEQCNAFTDIDTNNLNALSSGLSLFDIVETVSNYSLYLESVTSENSVNYFTIKKNGMVANLSHSEPFYFVEFETTWK